MKNTNIKMSELVLGWIEFKGTFGPEWRYALLSGILVKDCKVSHGIFLRK